MPGDEVTDASHGSASHGADGVEPPSLPPGRGSLAAAVSSAEDEFRSSGSGLGVGQAAAAFAAVATGMPGAGQGEALGQASGHA